MAPGYPSWRHTTWAPLISQFPPRIVPHTPTYNTSTRPALEIGAPTSLKFKAFKTKKNVSYFIGENVFKFGAFTSIADVSSAKLFFLSEDRYLFKNFGFFLRLKHLYPSWFVISFSKVFLYHLRIMLRGQRHFWALNISLPPPIIFLQPENHCLLFSLKKAIFCDVLCYSSTWF